MKGIGSRRRQVATAFAVLGSLALVSSACGGDEDASGEYAATAGGFVIEPADEVGPDAFTAPVDTASGGTCDKAALLAQLVSRPDALREWSTVLDVPQSEVATYIDSLQPHILEADTDVTNHGLHDGHAYARQSRLVAGTAVLVDPNFSPEPVTAGTPNPADLDTTTSTPTTTDAPTTSMPTTTGPGSTTLPGATPQPVTRCKCGNPLLPRSRPPPRAPPPRAPPMMSTPASPRTRPRPTTTGTPVRRRMTQTRRRTTALPPRTTRPHRRTTALPPMTTRPRRRTTPHPQTTPHQRTRARRRPRATSWPTDGSTEHPSLRAAHPTGSRRETVRSGAGRSTHARDECVC